MQTVRSVGSLAAALLILLVRAPSVALDVTLDSGAGTQTIVDNDAFDLDITVGTIEFDVTVGAKLAARARVREMAGTIIRTVNIAAIPPDTHATFRNIDTAAATFSITVNSSSFPAVGPPLGWSVFYDGDADDPTPGDVEITSSSVSAVLESPPTVVETVTGPVISPPVAPASQPVEFDLVTGRGSDAAASTTATQVVFTFTAGPGDEIRIPDSELFNGTGLEVFVYNQSERCIDRMNRRAEQVAKAAGKSAEKCIKNVSSAGGGAATPCTSGLSSTKIDTATNRLLADYADNCSPLPAWGVNSCDTCISDAAAQAMRDIGTDVLGSAAIGTGDLGFCQRVVIKNLGRVLDTRWHVFRRCKKSNIESISSDEDLISTCLGPPQVDDSFKIALKEEKVIKDVQKKCADKGIAPVGSAFTGGVCSSQPDATFGACVNTRAACRFCLAINIADDIVPGLDCDAFDDGVSNGSCP